MLRNFWYALEFSKALRRGGRSVTMPCAGHEIVMRRDLRGRASALDTSLAGRPSAPVVERYGFVWVFVGDPDFPEAERPPIPVWDEWDDPRFAGFNVTGDFLWQANVERVLENGVDISHTPFVHRNSFGNPKRPEVEDYEVQATPWMAMGTVTLHPPERRSMKRRNREDPLEDRPGVRTSTAWYLPSIIRLEVHNALGISVLYDSNIPISRERTLTKWVSLRTFFTGRWADSVARKQVMPIFYEDQPIVEGQRPELLPFDLSAELHVRSDAMQLAYRRRRNQLLEDPRFALPPGAWDRPALGGRTQARSAP